MKIQVTGIGRLEQWLKDLNEQVEKISETLRHGPAGSSIKVILEVDGQELEQNPPVAAGGME